MNIQDKLERILREMHLMISRGSVYPENEEYVLVHKQTMQKELTLLTHAVSEMLEAYELTLESRNRAELEVKRQQMELVRSANHQVEDIYAASVIYTDDALGRIQDIIEEAEKATRQVLQEFTKEMEEEKRIVRRNQLELKTQLEDMRDSGKYLRIIEERNKEIERAKARKNIGKAAGEYQRRIVEKSLVPEALPMIQQIDLAEEEPEIVYEKPEIRVNEEYFRKREMQQDTDEILNEEPPKEEKKGLLSFIRRDK